jgi:hypothetical protein
MFAIVACSLLGRLPPLRRQPPAQVSDRIRLRDDASHQRYGLKYGGDGQKPLERSIISSLRHVHVYVQIQ